jgi:hypothetical protein
MFLFVFPSTLEFNFFFFREILSNFSMSSLTLFKSIIKQDNIVRIHS